MWKEVLAIGGLSLAGALIYDLSKYLDRAGRAKELEAAAKLDKEAQEKYFDFCFRK